MKVIKVGIIGCGKIAQFRHLPEYSLLPHVEIVAVCDSQRVRAEQISKEYNIPYVFQDYRELIDTVNVDAISICTPNSTHAEVAIYALNSGKHVFVEKPMATTVEDCLQMVQAAERNKRILCVGHQQRFNPLHQRVKEILDSGILGKVYQFSTNYHHGGPEFWSIDGSKNWFFNRLEAGLGVIGDLGVHKIDLIQWLLGEQISQLKCFYSTVQKNANVEDSAVLIASFDSGAVGTINLSWNNPLQDHRTVLYCGNGVLTLGETLDSFEITFFDGNRVVEEVSQQLNNDGKIVSGIIEHFASCVCTGQDLSISASDAMHSTCLLIEAMGEVS